MSRKYPCAICKRVFKSEKEVSKHFRMHIRHKHQCKICGLVFSGKAELRNHINETH